MWHTRSVLAITQLQYCCIVMSVLYENKKNASVHVWDTIFIEMKDFSDALQRKILALKKQIGAAFHKRKIKV